MLKKILFIVNVVLALLLLCSYIAAVIPPHVFPKLSLLSFLYPVLLAVNIIFIIIWIFLKWTYAIFPLICICVRIDYLPSVYRLSGEEHMVDIPKSSIKILSYNVCSFEYKGVDKKRERMDSIYNFIQRENPDIVALQDYYCSERRKKDFHSRLITLGYDYYSSKNGSGYVNGNAIYSKLPILRSGVLLPMRDNADDYMFIDVKKDNHKFRIYNLHLASFKLDSLDKASFKKIKKGNFSFSDKGDGIIKKLLIANELRSLEVDELKPILEKTMLPYFIVGDFNDTPFSYTYRNLSQNTSDAFKSNGSGLGSTYNGVFPAYRIDYILYSKEFKNLSFEKKNLDYSDHYPVSAIFTLEK